MKNRKRMSESQIRRLGRQKIDQKLNMSPIAEFANDALRDIGDSYEGNFNSIKDTIRILKEEGFDISDDFDIDALLNKDYSAPIIKFSLGSLEFLYRTVEDLRARDRLHFIYKKNYERKIRNLLDALNEKARPTRKIKKKWSRRHVPHETHEPNAETKRVIEESEAGIGITDHKDTDDLFESLGMTKAKEKAKRLISKRSKATRGKQIKEGEDILTNSNVLDVVEKENKPGNDLALLKEVNREAEPEFPVKKPRVMPRYWSRKPKNKKGE